jgi:hypothetical protein
VYREEHGKPQLRRHKGTGPDLKRGPIIKTWLKSKNPLARGATSLRAIEAALNARGISAARGGQWSSTQVRRVLGRL